MSRLILPRRFAAEDVVPAPPLHEGGDPLHLTSRILTLQSGSGGGVNAVALRNPYDHPIAVRELKFRIIGGSGGVSTTTMNRINGDALIASISLINVDGSKRFKMTGSPVPVWSFNPGRVGQGGGVALTAGLGGEYQQVIQSTPSVSFSVAEYAWTFAHPLYIPPGYGIEPSVTATGVMSSLTSTFGFQFSVLGKALRPGTPAPKEIRIPFGTAYVSKSFDIETTSEDTDYSPETDLMNTTGYVFNVERFTCRCLAFLSSATRGQDDDDAVACRTFQFRMVNSKGDAIVDRATPIRAVFPSDERAIEIPHQMAPYDFYQVYLAKGAVDTASAGAISARASFGLVGWYALPRRLL